MEAAPIIAIQSLVSLSWWLLIQFGTIIAFIVLFVLWWKTRKQVHTLEQSCVRLSKLIAQQRNTTTSPDYNPASLSFAATNVQTVNEMKLANRQEEVEQQVPQQAEQAAEPSTPATGWQTTDVQAELQEWASSLSNRFKNSDNPAINMLKRFFTRSNWVAKVGIIILFFGCTFLIKYASQHNYLPIEFRLVATAIFGIILLGLGWRMRHKARHATFAVILQGGGIGIFYLVVFAAFRLYAVMPATAALSFLVIAVAGTIALALLQNARALAVLGTCGGFLAPFLISTGAGNYIALFSYYLILNGAILSIAWFKAWRLLNLLGFVFTFVLTGLWSVAAFQSSQLIGAEIFLGLFILIYVFISIFYAYRQQPKLKHYLDGTLIFGVPLLAFSIQIVLLNYAAHSIAISALVLGVFYILLAKGLLNYSREHFLVLSQAYFAIAIIFATIAIPLAFDAHWAGTFWALESAGILWLCLKQQRLFGRLFAYALQVGAGLLFLLDLPSISQAHLFLNAQFLGAVVLSIAGLTSAYLLYHFRNTKPWEKTMGSFLLYWGLAWWVVISCHQLHYFLFPQVDVSMPWRILIGTDRAVFYYCLLWFFSGSSLGLIYLHRKLAWQQVCELPLLLLPILIVLGFSLSLAIRFNYHIIPWLFSFAVWYWTLYQQERRPQSYLENLHIISFALVLWQVIIYCEHWVDYFISGASSWHFMLWGLLPAASLFLLQHDGEKLRWPVMAHQRTYRGKIGLLLVTVILAWILYSSLTHSAAMTPLPYLPIINPLDISVLIGLGSIIYWFSHTDNLRFSDMTAHSQRLLYTAAAVVVFIWLNAVLIRTFHHWFDVSLHFHAIYHSQVLQMALSIFWGLLALACMVIARQQSWRTIWIIGAILIAMVVVKLFFVDLANHDRVERIISFIAVGLLLLVIGYLAPIPPKHKIKENLL